MGHFHDSIDFIHKSYMKFDIIFKECFTRLVTCSNSNKLLFDWVRPGSLEKYLIFSINFQ